MLAYRVRSEVGCRTGGGQSDYPKVNIPGSWYKSVNFGAVQPELAKVLHEHLSSLASFAVYPTAPSVPGAAGKEATLVQTPFPDKSWHTIRFAACFPPPRAAGLLGKRRRLVQNRSEADLPKYCMFSLYPRGLRGLSNVPDLTAVDIYDKHSVGPFIRPVCTRCCFTMTNMIKVCSNFLCARLFIMNTRPDEIRKAP